MVTRRVRSDYFTELRARENQIEIDEQNRRSAASDALIAKVVVGLVALGVAARPRSGDPPEPTVCPSFPICQALRCETTDRRAIVRRTHQVTGILTRRGGPIVQSFR